MIKRFVKKLAGILLNNIYSSWEAKRYYEKILVPMVKKYPTGKRTVENLNSILQVNTLDNQGGAAKVAFRLFKALNSRGYDVKMLVRNARVTDPNIKELKIDKVLKQAILQKGEACRGWQDFLYPASLELKDMEWFTKCDILHLHNLHGGYFSIFSLPQLTALKPTIWTLHDMQAITGHCAHSFDCDRWIQGCGECPDIKIYPGISKDTTSFLWATKKWIYDLSDLTIVCPSKWLMGKVANSILADKELHLIYNGVDRNVFKTYDKESVRKQLNLPLNKKILLFNADGGKENPWKGGQYLVEAYKRLNERYDILFLNIGGKSGKAPKRNWIDVGYISDENTMALYYSAADLFVYPSLADNCPLVVLEAMSCGTPVIAFQTGGIPELVSHLNTGYLARYKDLNDFVHGVKTYIENEDLLAKAVFNAPLEIQKRFTIEKMTESYLNLYNSLLSNK